MRQVGYIIVDTEGTGLFQHSKIVNGEKDLRAELLHNIGVSKRERAQRRSASELPDSSH